MNITILSPDFPPKISGGGDYTYWLAKTLSNIGNDVSVITSPPAKAKRRAGKIEDVKYERNLKILPIVENWGVIHIFKIIDLIKNLKPNIIIIQYVSQAYGRAGIAPGIVLLAFFIKLVSNIKIVITFHELYIPWSSRDFLIGFVQRVQCFALVLLSEASIVTTKNRKKRLDAYFPFKKKRILKIPVGANVHPLADIEKQKRNNKNDDFIISTFGTIHIGRDFVTLFMAFSLIPSAKLTIIGAIDRSCLEYQSLRKLSKKLHIEERIFWTGPLPSEQVANYLSATDIYASLQQWGPSGRRGSLMAALSFGLPIIAYNGKDTEKVFENNENIILIPPEKHEILARKIKELIKNKLLRIRLGDEAKKTFETYFTWEIISKKYEKVFNVII